MSRPADTHRRDFEAYIRFRLENMPEGADFCPWRAPNFPDGSADPLTAFTAFDSRGKIVGCRWPGAVQFAIEGKKLLNWHIKQWAESMDDTLVSVDELREEFPWLPEWTWAAVESAHIRQMVKRAA